MSKWLLRLSNLFAIFWLICIVGVIGILALATKFMTHDPDFSTGLPEHIYLLPMLLFFFIGIGSFGAMVLAGLLSFLSKPQLKAFIPFKFIFGIFVFIGFGLFSFGFAIKQQNISSYSTAEFTGDDIFRAVNEERVKNGKVALTIDPVLCDNLVQRYLDIKNPDNEFVGHAGFERWLKQEGIDKQGYALAEIYNSGSQTPQDAIDFWNSSPGHKSAMLGDYIFGCAYANEGISIVILGKK